MQKTTVLASAAMVLAAFLAGRWSDSGKTVKADSVESPRIQVQSIRGDSSLTIYYPDINKVFVYQSPFVGLPKWGCSYSIQLSSAPGGPIDREPCANPGQIN